MALLAVVPPQRRLRPSPVALAYRAQDIVTMGALAIVDRLLRGNFELGIKITLGFFPMRS